MTETISEFIFDDCNTVIYYRRIYFYILRLKDYIFNYKKYNLSNVSIKLIF